MKKQVVLQIHSTAKEQQFTQVTDGELYEKGTHVYIRYQETDPNMGRTTTTVKVDTRLPQDKPSIKILRHGDVQAEQTFDLNQRWPGFYVTPHLRMDLATETHAIDVNLENGLGSLSWSYDLYVDEQPMGTYQLKLDIQEGQ